MQVDGLVGNRKKEADSSALLEAKDLHFRKSVVSTKFLPAILGPEMAAPILWAPGIFWFFLLENTHAHKIPPFRGGVRGFLRRGGGSANFIFMGVGIFPSIAYPLMLQSASLPRQDGINEDGKSAINISNVYLC